jgi:hypothetical protein
MPATRQRARALGEHALQGWRKRVADVAAPRIAKRAPVRERDIRAVLGLLFIALAIRHLVVTLKRFAEERERRS